MSSICQHINLIHSSCCQSLKTAAQQIIRLPRAKTMLTWSKSHKNGSECHMLGFIVSVFPHLIPAAGFLAVRVIPEFPQSRFEAKKSFLKERMSFALIV